MAAIRNGIFVLLICTLPYSASAGCGAFNPCGPPSWIGFSLALPVPRFAHLHTFAVQSCQSPLCGGGLQGGGCGLPGGPGGYGYGCGGCGIGGCGLLGHGLFGHGCGLGCGLGHCGNPCLAPAPCGPPVMSPPVLSPPVLMPPQTTGNPCAPAVTQTQLVPQQTVTYRDVPQIQYRQEAYTESVPVTTYQQVTRFRSVPFQTTTRIPQISTQFVPQLTAAAPCDPCMAGISAPIYGAPTNAAALPYLPTSISQPPMSAVPEYAYPVPQPQTDPVAQWQTVPQLQAQQPIDVQQMGYYPPTLPAEHQQAAPRSMFRPAPSAATAWQSRWLR